MTEYAVAPTIISTRLADARRFYEHFFGATTVFDAGWYLSLALPGGQVLSFQEPGGGGELGHADPEFAGAGLILNLMVDDVDAEYRRLVGAGLPAPDQPQDNPLGFRAFEVRDPSGITLFVTTMLDQPGPGA